MARRLPNNFISNSGAQMSLPMIADQKYPQGIPPEIKAPKIRAGRIRRNNQKFKTKRYNKYKITDKQRHNINKRKRATPQHEMTPNALWKYWREVIVNQKEAHIGDARVTELFHKMEGVKKKDFVKDEELLDEVYALNVQYRSVTGRGERTIS